MGMVLVSLRTLQFHHLRDGTLRYGGATHGDNRPFGRCKTDRHGPVDPVSGNQKRPLSAIVSSNGAVRIDPAELERVFPVRTERDSDATSRETTRNVARPAELVARVAELEARLSERDERLTEARDQIADLRRRLDAEAEERRRLTAILADQRAATPAPARRWLPWGRR